MMNVHSWSPAGTPPCWGGFGTYSMAGVTRGGKQLACRQPYRNRMVANTV